MRMTREWGGQRRHQPDKRDTGKSRVLATKQPRGHVIISSLGRLYLSPHCLRLSIIMHMKVAELY